MDFLNRSVETMRDQMASVRQEAGLRFTTGLIQKGSSDVLSQENNCPCVGLEWAGHHLRHLPHLWQGAAISLASCGTYSGQVLLSASLLPSREAQLGGTICLTMCRAVLGIGVWLGSHEDWLRASVCRASSGLSQASPLPHLASHAGPGGPGCVPCLCLRLAGHCLFYLSWGLDRSNFTLLYENWLAQWQGKPSAYQEASSCFQCPSPPPHHHL